MFCILTCDSVCDANFGKGAASKLESPASQFTAEVRLPPISTWPKILLFFVVIFDCGHLWLWSLHDARFSPLLEHTGAPIPTKYFWRAPPTFGSRARSHKKRSGVQQRCVSSWAWLHGSGIWLFNHNVWLFLTSNVFHNQRNLWMISYSERKTLCAHLNTCGKKC